MAYSGKYKVKNPKKYEGDPNNVVYRSHWEKNCFMWCEKNDNVVRWSSEEIVVPYIWEVDGRMHRYFVDLKITYKDGTTILVEIKPQKETSPPVIKRRTKKALLEATTYVKNSNKWHAAKKFAKKQGWRFEIWTEKKLQSMGILPKPPKKSFKPFKKMSKKKK